MALEKYGQSFKTMAVTINGTTGIGYADDIKHKLGTGDDLQIYHNGTHSYFSNGTGNLFVEIPESQKFQVQHGSEAIINGYADDRVELYHDNSKKFETESTGVRVHGAIRLPDFTGSNEQLQLGDSQDLLIYHNGSDSYVKNSTGDLYIRDTNGNVYIQPKTDENGIKCIADGAVELYHDNTKKFETSSVGVSSLDTLITHGVIRPADDNNHAIGLSNRRYTEIFAVNGSINTSDKTEKNTIVESDLGLDFIKKLKPVSYKWNKDDGKTHYGLIAQDIEETITSLGKTVAEFGGVSKEKDSPMGLSYSELLSPLIKAVQELSAEVTTLKTRVAALEAA